MHTLILLFGALSFIAVWYWRLKVLKEVSRDGIRLFHFLRTLRMALRPRFASGGGDLSAISDPKEAATILMLEIAQASGPLSETQITAIRAEIMQHFDFSEAQAIALMRQAEWRARRQGPASEMIRQMTGIIQTAPDLGPKQIVDLDGMLVTVSEADGNPTPDQLRLLEQYRQQTGLRV